LVRLAFWERELVGTRGVGECCIAFTHARTHLFMVEAEEMDALLMVWVFMDEQLIALISFRAARQSG
jgi:hypothetical protein